MRNLQLFNLAILMISSFALFAQNPRRACATHENHLEHVKYNPDVLDNIEDIERQTQKYINNPTLETRNALISIPVVIHIVHRTANTIENISDDQIISQLDVLNQDYRRLNSDAKQTPSVFQPLSADCGIEFKLAKRTPDGKATTGILRYASTRRTPWGKSDEVKMPAMGGIAPWDATKYLNIYVCAIGSGVLGYSSMPGSLMAFDGVVIDYRYFGTKGTAVPPFNLGRTTTHEVGHWLNLRHTWGDNDCGDDMVGDTPQQKEPNYGCVTFPHVSCAKDSKGDMFMNFMDYTDDACMNMFSQGQKARIKALFAFGGARVSLLNSNALLAPNDNCKAPANLLTQNEGAKTIQITWDAVDNIKDYIIEYKPKNTSEWLSVTAKNTTTITLLNLTPNTAYDCRAKADCNDKADYTNLISFTTLSKEKEGIDGFKTVEKLQTYPNPATETLNIELETIAESEALIRLTDFMGRTLVHKAQTLSPTNNVFRLDVMTVNSGLYILSVKVGSEVFSKKVLVAKQ